MIKFASISPHPPILLPSVGSEQDRLKLEKTIESLEYLAKSFKKASPDCLIISSPHPDWGFKVPLYFIANDFKGEIEYFLTELEPPKFYFDKGKQFYLNLEKNKSYGLIASGDLSHCLKKDGPYGFYPDGPEFDKYLIKYLKEKDIENFLKLDEMFPEAGECGLRSFSFLLGILEESKLDWQPEILSYQGPFGVGYLVASIQIKN
jgi:aromatic ring-opening dioxygenase LigB subunit